MARRAGRSVRGEIQLSPVSQRLLTGLCAAALTGALAGCGTVQKLAQPRPAPAPLSIAETRAPSLQRPAESGGPLADIQATQDDIAALVPAEPIDVALPPQPLPQLINTVFGDILKTPYAVGPDVAQRTDIVALRGVSGMSKRDFFRLVQVALKNYGVRVYIHDRVVNIVADTASNGPPPIVLKGQPGANTDAAQPASQLFEAHSIEVGALVALMSDVFPQAGNLTFSADAVSNTVVVTGGPRDVAAAVSVLQQLDQPQFSGSSVFRAQPVFWSADSLAKSLQDALRAEGYRVSGAPGTPRSVLVMPFASVNQVLVFARDPAVLTRARAWIDKLDQPAAFSGGSGTFIYQVQNIDARSLSELVSDESDHSAGPAQPTAAAAAPGSPPANAPSSLSGGGGGSYKGGRLIVDPTGNRILFNGAAEDFAQLRSLLVALDVPLKEVLVEVTIAEVTLTDQTQLGLEWFFQHSMKGGVLSGGTQGGLGIGKNGLTLNFNRSDLQASFDAFASNNNVNILSRPRLVARSGSEAHIQVGTDVPIITSQMNSPTSTAGSTDILQSIQYRSTGIILHIKPVVYGEDQVNLEITQEVSSEQDNPNAAIGSPLILNRNVATELSLADGSTAVLGGLIDTSYTKGNSGIPLFKDVPLLGQGFRTDTVSANKTELVMLVTPHILRDSDQMSRWANRYSDEMDAAFKVGKGWSRTLTPYDSRKDLKVPASKAASAAP